MRRADALLAPHINGLVERDGHGIRHLNCFSKHDSTHLERILEVGVVDTGGTWAMLNEGLDVERDKLCSGEVTYTTIKRDGGLSKSIVAR